MAYIIGGVIERRWTAAVVALAGSPSAPCSLARRWRCALCAVHWPRSLTPGVKFVQDIVIPLGFALFACAGIIGGYALLSA
jgi:hypothetical protein